MQVGGDQIKLSDVDGELLGEIKYAGFDTFNYLGDGSVDKVDVDPGSSSPSSYLDGGGGVGDKLNVATNDSLVKISDEAVSLNFSKIEIAYKQFTDFGLVADKTTPLDVEVNGFQFDKMDFAGERVRGRLDQVDERAAGGAGRSAIRSSSPMSTVSWWVRSSTPGSTRSTISATARSTRSMSIPGSSSPSSYLDGGGGVGDKLNVATDDSLVKISDEAISLNFSKIDIDYKEFTDFGLVSDKTTPLDVEVNGFHFDKMDFGGSGFGGDSIKLTSGLPAVQVIGDQIKLSDVAVGRWVRSSTPGSTRSTISATARSQGRRRSWDQVLQARISMVVVASATSSIVATDDSLVKISDDAISLNFSKIDINYKQFTDFGLVADKTTPLALEIDGFKFTNMDVAGGAVGELDQVDQRSAGGAGRRRSDQTLQRGQVVG